MKKSVRSLVIIIASTMLLTSTFVGCKSNGATKKTDETKTAAAATTAETKAAPITIRMFNRVNAQVVIENNPVIAEVEKLANVKISLEAPPINNYVDKLQIVMASGDIPDLIYNWGGADANMETWAKNGLIANIDDKISKYPNLMKNITTELWNAVKSLNDGKIYIVPRTNIVNHWGYIINQTWLDKLKLKAPTTLEEFTNMCRMFTKNDPDGNGKNDTFGVTLGNPLLGANTIWNGTSFLTSAFDLPIVNGVKDTDGNYKIREKMSGYIPYLTYMKQLNDEKIIDPEFLINKVYVDADKLNQSRIGLIPHFQVGVMSNLSKDKESDKKYTYNAPLKNSKGVASDWIIPAMWGGWMISKTSKNIDGILKFLDWGNTQESNVLLTLGIKGLTYNSYDPATKLISRTEDQAAKLTTMASTFMTIAYAIDGSSPIIEGADTLDRVNKYKKEFDEALKLVKTVNVPAVRSSKILNLTTSIPDIVKKKDEQEVKYILGQITLQQFKDFLEKEWYPATADAEKEYVDSMNKLGK